MTFVFLLVSGVILEVAVALIPRPCRENLTEHVSICCPSPEGSTVPCGGPGFGECRQFRVHRDHRGNWPNKTLADDRFDWPTRLFQHGCHCEGNRWGYACQECWFGWTGSDCQTRQLSVRRNYRNYTAQEKSIFRNVLIKLYKIPSKDFVIFEEKNSFLSDPLQKPVFLEASILQVLVFIHRYASRTTLYKHPMDCFTQARLDFIHYDVGFLTWHRFFMLFWERQAAKVAKEQFGVEDFRFPYWDWTDAKVCEPCVEDMVGDLSIPGHPKNLSPFKAWRAFCEPPDDVERACIGCHYIRRSMIDWPRLWRRWQKDTTFPTKSQVDFALTRKRYFAPLKHGEICQSFVHALEGRCRSPGTKERFVMHNAVHDFSLGPFSTSGGSPNDPLFPLHHLQVDRVVAAWFRKFRPKVTDIPNDGVLPGHCRECNLVGFLPPVPHQTLVVDIQSLGYDYDNFVFGHVRV